MWSILDTAHEAFVSMDAAGRITGWNQAAQRTFGYSREDVEGRELAETIVPERYRAKHREGMARFLATGEHAVLDQRLELWALHRDGCEFPIEITIACGGDAGDTGDAGVSAAESADAGGGVAEPTLHAFLQDISDRQLSTRVLRAMQSVTTAMARADTPREALEALLDCLGEDMAWDVGAFGRWPMTAYWSWWQVGRQATWTRRSSSP
jgi:PAS domain S-box-containing protein